MAVYNEMDADSNGKANKKQGRSSFRPPLFLVRWLGPATRLLELAAGRDRPDAFNDAVADAIEVFVEMVALVAVADRKGQPIADLRGRGRRSKLENAVLG
jgi:hypothetical protein